MNYIRLKVPMDVLVEVEHITGTVPGKVFYSDDGEALILTADDYVVRVTPPDVILPGFNNGNPTTSSAYLFSDPAEHECPNNPGWATGWSC